VEPRDRSRQHPSRLNRINLGGRITMNRLIRTLLASVLVAAPAFALAQSAPFPRARSRSSCPIRRVARPTCWRASSPRSCRRGSGSRWWSRTGAAPAGISAASRSRARSRRLHAGARHHRAQRGLEALPEPELRPYGGSAAGDPARREPQRPRRAQRRTGEDRRRASGDGRAKPGELTYGSAAAVRRCTWQRSFSST